MQPPKYITAHCQATNVKWNDRDYSIQKDRNGFRYIKVSHDGKRKVIPIKEEVPDMVFDYVFNYGFRNDNPILNICAMLRGCDDKRASFERLKSKAGLNIPFEEFKRKSIEMNRNFKTKTK